MARVLRGGCLEDMETGGCSWVRISMHLGVGMVGGFDSSWFCFVIGKNFAFVND